MHYYFEIFALFETNFAGRKKMKLKAAVKIWEMLAATKVKMNGIEKKKKKKKRTGTRTTRVDKG